MVMPNTVSRKQYLIGGILVVLLAIGLFGILPQIGDFDESFAALKQANVAFVVAAVAASLASVGFSALIYQTLSIKRLAYSNTLLVQLSGLFINRILPAGVGGLGLNYLYLRSHKHALPQAAAVVTLNNTVGLLGHIVLALILLLAAPTLFSDVDLPVTAIIAIIVAIIAGVIAVRILLQKRPKKLKAWRAVLRYYTARPGSLLRALFISLALTLSNVGALWLCCQALGISLNFFVVFVIFTAGIIVGTATPTPGGLGGTEAALVAALMSQDVTASLALAVALLYRLSSYWIGLVIGASALAAVYKRQLLQARR